MPVDLIEGGWKTPTAKLPIELERADQVTREARCCLGRGCASRPRQRPMAAGEGERGAREAPARLLRGRGAGRSSAIRAGPACLRDPAGRAAPGSRRGSFGDIVDTLANALDLVADCRRAYLAAPGHLRGQWIQALLKRIVVYDERIADTEIAELFATLADPELPKRLDGEAVTGTGTSTGGSSNEELLIGAPGFEPGTSPTRTVRATRLRHAPRAAIISERRGPGGLVRGGGATLPGVPGLRR